MRTHTHTHISSAVMAVPTLRGTASQVREESIQKKGGIHPKEEDLFQMVLGRKRIVPGGGRRNSWGGEEGLRVREELLQGRRVFPGRRNCGTKEKRRELFHWEATELFQEEERRERRGKRGGIVRKEEGYCSGEIGQDRWRTSQKTKREGELVKKEGKVIERRGRGNWSKENEKTCQGVRCKFCQKRENGQLRLKKSVTRKEELVKEG